MTGPDAKDWQRVFLYLLLVVALTWCDQTRAEDEKKPNEGSWITFVSHRNGNSLLYRMRPDGTE
jgi:hypothetical protein